MKIPLPITLRKYGITDLEYTEMFNRQDGVCAICKREPKDGEVFHTDHVHVKGWKKMEPRERKKFVRGVCCQFCNRFYMAQRMTIQKAENIIKYLQAFEEKR